jgi:hypothetical protein
MGASYSSNREEVNLKLLDFPRPELFPRLWNVLERPGKLQNIRQI